MALHGCALHPCEHPTLNFEPACSFTLQPIALHNPTFRAPASGARLTLTHHKRICEASNLNPEPLAEPRSTPTPCAWVGNNVTGGCVASNDFLLAIPNKQIYTEFGRCEPT